MAAQNGDEFANTFASFSLKVVITDLTITDGKEDTEGYNNILLSMTFDGNDLKIGDFVKKPEGGGIQPVGQGFDFRITPKKFIEKLHVCPIMFNLARGCAELGTTKLDVSDCFINVVTCKEFLKETCTTDLIFIFEEVQNAEMTLILQLTREDDDYLYKGLKRPTEEIPVLDSSTASPSCSEISFPTSVDEDSIHCEETRPPKTCASCQKTPSKPKLTIADPNPCNPARLSKSCDSCNKSSSKSKSVRSKCNSDIATSLEIGEVSTNQQTFCSGCGKYSVSGVTCDNKNSASNVLPSPCKSKEKVSSKIQLKPITNSIKNCGKPPAKPPKRICSECFEDLSVLPGDTPCPKCTYNAQLERKLVVFKSEEVKADECEKVRDCIKSIFEELFFEAKDRLLDDWQRLKCKKKRKRKNNDQRCCETKTPKQPRMPR